jgi:two-component system, NarL family, sensor histidine kinase UhpB
VGADDLAERAASATARLRDAGDVDASEIIELLDRERTSLQRRLVRLGFDLHDGPLQALAASTADLRHFQHQLLEQLEGHPHADKLLGRVDDLVARDIALGEQIRALIMGADPDPTASATLSEALRMLAETFSGFDLQLDLDQSIDDLTLSDSQRITVLRVVRAALDNVGMHSGATSARVTVRTLPTGGVGAFVRDDGNGFDPGAARRPTSIGLVAMRERVRLLGGRFTVESTVGGPTTVSVELPPWLGPSGPDAA